MSEKSDIIDKIKKLLALSKSENQHEAELAAKRASDLMQKYQIDAAVVEASSIKSGKERVADVHFTVPDLRMKYQWVVFLGQAAAALFDGEILVNRRLHGTGFVFVGFKSEIPLMEQMFLHLYGSWKGFVETDLKAAKCEHENFSDAPWTPAMTMKFKHGHGQGYADALLCRCIAIAKERNDKIEQANVSCTALVLVRKDALVEWKKEKKIRSVRLKQTSGSSSGRSYGEAAGSRVALGGAITG